MIVTTANNPLTAEFAYESQYKIVKISSVEMFKLS